MRIVELTPMDFDIYAKDQELSNPWQTSNFGRAAEALGYTASYLGFEDGMSIKGVTLLLTKNVYLCGRLWQMNTSNLSNSPFGSLVVP